MKIVIIHGQSHKGSTYQIAHMLARKTGGEDSGKLGVTFYREDNYQQSYPISLK